MGTKNNPGEFDCYKNAAPDEPIFVLLGRDRHAPTLVRLWALLRYRDGEDEAKVAEALQCAKAMEAWQRSLVKTPIDSNHQIIRQFFESVTDGMSDHPDGYDYDCLCDECQAYP